MREREGQGDEVLVSSSPSFWGWELFVMSDGEGRGRGREEGR
jgi:hypothetical protein